MQRVGFTFKIKPELKAGYKKAHDEIWPEVTQTIKKRIGLQNTFGESGDYKLLLKKYKMDIDHIVDIAKKLMKSI